MLMFFLIVVICASLMKRQKVIAILFLIFGAMAVDDTCVGRIAQS